MRLIQKHNVFDSSLDRIRYLFDEFPNVIVGFSGGKDSTICLQLCLKVAEEKGRLPQKVLFLDQEVEWQTNIDYIRTVMNDPRVDPMWMQVPLMMTNETSHTEHYLDTWAEGKDDVWMRPKEPNSYKEDKYDCYKFSEMFEKIIGVEFPDTPTCYIAGMRAEESPPRAVAVMHGATYKHITYGKILNRKKSHYTFYPIYDWTYVDVWKAIEDNEWPYCTLYDKMYQHGIDIRNMRISNLNHATALNSLLMLQEIEPKTWVKVTKRLSGVNTVKHLSKASNQVPKECPSMFSGWKEYRDYLLENLITNEEHREMFRARIEKQDNLFDTIHHKDKLYKVQVRSLIIADKEMILMHNFERDPAVYGYIKWKTKGILPKQYNKYING